MLIRGVEGMESDGEGTTVETYSEDQGLVFEGKCLSGFLAKAVTA